MSLLQSLLSVFRSKPTGNDAAPTPARPPRTAAGTTKLGEGSRNSAGAKPSAETASAKTTEPPKRATPPRADGFSYKLWGVDFSPSNVESLSFEKLKSVVSGLEIRADLGDKIEVCRGKDRSITLFFNKDGAFREAVLERGARTDFLGFQADEARDSLRDHGFEATERHKESETLKLQDATVLIRYTQSGKVKKLSYVITRKQESGSKEAASTMSGAIKQSFASETEQFNRVPPLQGTNCSPEPAKASEDHAAPQASGPIKPFPETVSARLMVAIPSSTPLDTIYEVWALFGERYGHLRKRDLMIAACRDGLVVDVKIEAEDSTEAKAADAFLRKKFTEKGVRVA